MEKPFGLLTYEAWDKGFRNDAREVYTQQLVKEFKLTGKEPFLPFTFALVDVVPFFAG